MRSISTQAHKRKDEVFLSQEKIEGNLCALSCRTRTRKLELTKSDVDVGSKKKRGFLSCVQLLTDQYHHDPKAKLYFLCISTLLTENKIYFSFQLARGSISINRTNFLCSSKQRWLDSNQTYEQDLDTTNTMTPRGTTIQKNNLKRKIVRHKRVIGQRKQKKNLGFLWTIGDEHE